MRCASRAGCNVIETYLVVGVLTTMETMESGNFEIGGCDLYEAGFSVG